MNLSFDDFKFYFFNVTTTTLSLSSNMSLAKNLGGGDKEKLKGWEGSIFFLILLLICENPERPQKFHGSYTLSPNPLTP
jgi:hypothetical protein